MNRRKFLSSVVGVGAVAATGAGVAVADTSRKWGYVDVRKHTLLKSRNGIDLHVFHNGEDVTRRCFEFDDEFDYARLYKHDVKGGRVYRDRATGKPAQETVHGFTIRAFAVNK